MNKSTADKIRRRRALLRGRMAEIFVAFFLRLKGYRILARQFRKPVGEIDIVALKKSCLVAVEVKFRTTETDLSRVVSAKQKRRIRRCLEAFRAEHPQFCECDMRCDLVILSTFLSRPVQYENAWQ